VCDEFDRRGGERNSLSDWDPSIQGLNGEKVASEIECITIIRS